MQGSYWGVSISPCGDSSLFPPRSLMTEGSSSPFTNLSAGSQLELPRVGVSGILPRPPPATRLFTTRPRDTHLAPMNPRRWVGSAGNDSRTRKRFWRKSADGSIACSRLVRGSPHLSVRFPNSAESIMVGPGVESQFSPDGKWISFTEPGGSSVNVRPYPALRPLIKISAGPAAQ